MTQVQVAELVGLWPGEGFEPRLLQVLAALPAASLPLQALTQGGMVAAEQGIGFSVLDVRQEEDEVVVRMMVFFTEIVINCGCGDEPYPTPVCGEWMLRLQPASGELTLEVAA